MSLPVTDAHSLYISVYKALYCVQYARPYSKCAQYWRYFYPNQPADHRKVCTQIGAAVVKRLAIEGLECRRRDKGEDKEGEPEDERQRALKTPPPRAVADADEDGEEGDESTREEARNEGRKAEAVHL